MSETEVGVVEHFFDKIGVAAITITKGKLVVGDTIHITGSTTDVTVTIESMQMEHDQVAKAKKGDGVGIKTGEKVREHDKIFKVTE